MPDIADMLIRGVKVDVRQRAVQSAKEAKETMAEWFEAAANAELNRRAGIRINPPDKQEREAPPAPVIDHDKLALAATALDAMGKAAAAGLPVSKTAARHAVAILSAGLAEMRGMAAGEKERDERGRFLPRISGPINVAKSEFIGMTLEGKADERMAAGSRPV